MNICKHDECNREVFHGKTQQCRQHYSQWYYENNKEAFKERARKQGAPNKPGRRKAVTGYFNAHKRVKWARGPATQFACVDCNRSANEWALIAGMGECSELIRGRYLLSYSMDVNNYEPKCFKCHRSKDFAKEVTA